METTVWQTWHQTRPAQLANKRFTAPPIQLIGGMGRIRVSARIRIRVLFQSRAPHL